MTPIVFGASESPLFGVMMAPAAANERRHGVLLCPPIGHEHVRSHWAFRQLGGALTRAGFHVLRFDWFGVGDSAGDLHQATVARWLDDAEAAADELRDSAGVRKISVVGLRFGATLAALGARKLKPHTLVLWDAVFRGTVYVDALWTLHQRALRDPLRYWQRWPRYIDALAGELSPRRAAAHETPSDELVGFKFGSALLQEIRSIEMEALEDLPRCRLGILGSGTGSQPELFAARLREKNATVDFRTAATSGAWDAAGKLEDLLLPADSLRLIVEMLEGAG